MEAGSDAKPNNYGLQIVGAQVMPKLQLYESKGFYIFWYMWFRQK
jgi:hypothetical protein